MHSCTLSKVHGRSPYRGVQSHLINSLVSLACSDQFWIALQGWVVYWPFRRVTRSKARLGCALTIPAAYEIESEVVHWPFQRVSRSKVGLGCVLTVPAGDVIESEAELWIDHSGGSRDRKGDFLFRNWLRYLLWSVVLRFTGSWFNHSFIKKKKKNLKQSWLLAFWKKKDKHAISDLFVFVLFVALKKRIPSKICIPSCFVWLKSALQRKKWKGVLLFSILCLEF